MIQVLPKGQLSDHGGDVADEADLAPDPVHLGRAKRRSQDTAGALSQGGQGG